MYYESRTYKVMDPSGSYDELVNNINNSPDSVVHTIINEKGHKIAFVPDGHIDHPKQELAILDLTDNKQLESWTWAWIKEEKKVDEIKAIANTDYVMSESIHFNDQVANVFFTCGCCGTSFQSTIEEQRKFDQDSSYGICDSCSKYYL